MSKMKVNRREFLAVGTSAAVAGLAGARAGADAGS